jgi:hypothetical protein
MLYGESTLRALQSFAQDHPLVCVARSDPKQVEELRQQVLKLTDDNAKVAMLNFIELVVLGQCLEHRPDVANAPNTPREILHIVVKAVRGFCLEYSILSLYSDRVALLPERSYCSSSSSFVTRPFVARR